MMYFLQIILDSDQEILSLISFFQSLYIPWIFFGISKTFGKVWHDGLIFKLCQNGVFGEMINFLEDFLSDRKKRGF